MSIPKWIECPNCHDQVRGIKGEPRCYRCLGRGQILNRAWIEEEDVLAESYWEAQRDAERPKRAKSRE